MIAIGITLLLVGLILVIVLMFEYTISNIIVIVIIVGLGIWSVVYDVKSPTEIIDHPAYIGTILNNIEFDQPMRIIRQERNATRFMAIGNDNENYHYIIESLTEEELEVLTK